jgi:hypothetical protein
MEKPEGMPGSPAGARIIVTIASPTKQKSGATGIMGYRRRLLLFVCA